MNNSIAIRKYINSDTDPYYVDANEYEAQLHSPTKSAKLTVYEDPELTTPVKKMVGNKEKTMTVNVVDIILKRI